VSAPVVALVEGVVPVTRAASMFAAWAERLAWIVP
jgi:hypothetical protein